MPTDKILYAAEKLTGNAFKLYVLLYICKLTPAEIEQANLMHRNTIVYNISKVWSEKI